MAAFELGKRLDSLHPEDRPVVASPQEVFNMLGAEMSLLQQEHLRVILLDTKNHVWAVQEVYIGNVSSVSVRVADVLRLALRENCSSINLVHNHPSGDLTPSLEDVLVTRETRTSGEMMDIELLDHVIIGSNGYVRMKEKSLGFN